MREKEPMEDEKQQQRRKEKEKRDPFLLYIQAIALYPFRVSVSTDERSRNQS